ncbi:hypothetical protein WMY93_017320 [Mugilogobius chulae]|uniref:Uncharacterized protein n=1 Tax=Mugilogobius chulae TaxID=88201 RepID=A0AAW0NQL2_9GOBI
MIVIGADGSLISVYNWSYTTPPSVRRVPDACSAVTLLRPKLHWRNARVPLMSCACCFFCWARSAHSGLFSLTSHNDNLRAAAESGEQPCIRLEPVKNTHLPGKTSPSPGKRAVYGDTDSKVTANGVHDIEDRILRITGYYGTTRVTPATEVSEHAPK